MLTHLDVDDFRRLLARGESPPSGFRFPGIELGAALELSSAFVESRDASVLKLLEAWSRADARLAGARAALDGTISEPELFSAPTLEFASLRSRQDLDRLPSGFCGRFERSLKNHGFGKKLANAIAKSFFDMADNVIQHSGPDVDHPAPGALAYEVAERSCAFAVTDVGRGVLASLTSNPDWRHLSTSEQALDAAVRNGASRREGQGKGQGFSELHRALADLLGTLRFASGDSVLQLQGEPDKRIASRGSRPPLHGFQITVSLNLQ